ncbi:hypothetical protein BD324DRAFT_641367 [Kockovaella imperatae]|uniref:F-box domain-containing protein n=1 Tax=Kockovaella imperatae TaxID=4999 RepID=A0A1Y1UPZ7_9TREE|nr:hypothetical protein BD324DRAFT_641367 [Kockovaella imperatae]ORX39215.1 hypothetical protein BD324DRAFT_641367 [Kockovaella imperatae]
MTEKMSEDGSLSSSLSQSSADSIILSPMSIESESRLLKSPSEILHRVLCTSGADDPFAIAQAAKTCSQLRSFIYDNPDSALWRDIYLQRYDDPKRAGAFCSPRPPPNWRKQVQDRELVSRMLRTWDKDDLVSHLDLIASTLLDLYLDLPATTAPSSSDEDPLETDESPNGILLSSLLQSEGFRDLYFEHSTTETKPLLRPLRAQPGNPNRQVQRRAVNADLMRLHVLLSPDFSDEEVHRQQRGWLREMVYGASNYSVENDWGPFNPDGTVDWTLVDAVGSVMMGNAKDVLFMGEDTWRQALPPMSYGIEPTRGWGFNDLSNVEDWAGVEGVWCGSYAFLDLADLSYTDWITLNEPGLIQLRRSLNTLDLTRYHEAVGDLMRLELVIDREGYKPEPMPRIETNLPTSSLLPPIYFHGSSVQQSSAITFASNSSASFVRGVVQLTADDPPQVRWTLVIRYGGEDRWRLECVQVGGRGSKRGFFGIWTDALKEEHSPNGPVWYWKP